MFHHSFINLFPSDSELSISEILVHSFINQLTTISQILHLRNGRSEIYQTVNQTWRKW